MIFEKCCDMRLSLSPTNDLSFDNGETPPRQKGTRSARIFILFPAHAIGLSRCRATDGTNKIFHIWLVGRLPSHDQLSYLEMPLRNICFTGQCFFLLSLIGLWRRSCPIL